MDSSQTSFCVKGCGFYSNSGMSGMCSKCWKSHISNLSTEDLKNEIKTIQDRKKEVTQHVENTEKTIDNIIKKMDELDEEIDKIEKKMDEFDNQTNPIDKCVVIPEQSQQQPQQQKKRCAKCSKKLSVCQGIECRCKNIYCSVHRYPEEHDCEFNYDTVDIGIHRSVGHGKFEKLEKI